MRVLASALSPLTRGRAAGTHYSSSSLFPFVAGVDGVGQLDDGRRVYFLLPRAPFGGMAEETVAPEDHCLPLPEGLDDMTAAAIANPGMSSWAALTERARFKAGESVLINGATGASGQLAVQIAKHKGARRIVATGRDRETLAALQALGADAIIPLSEDADALEAAFREEFAKGIDVVLDYLWGMSAERLLIAGAKSSADGVPLRFIQIGNASGANISLPGAVLRSSAIELMGSGIGSVPLGRLIAAIGAMLEAAVAGGFSLATETMPLADLDRGWNAGDRRRIVFIPNG
ncbi:quinone oxidoreductase family protein [Flavisphingomonas formosensis]|uniref:quinone oxidoreductase family protein n=1 Tax=Flavisphingomonas formosensis TaxID=861534 RepID=UPI001E38DA07|nr:zinc-binding alcohol dehydrogenase family protein [Sphingomonas formosensis]